MTQLRYEITVSGVVPTHVLEELENVAVTVRDVTTILRGPLTDQSALHGMINRLHRAGIQLIGIRRIGFDNTELSAHDIAR